MKILSDFEKLTAQWLSKLFFKEEQLNEEETKKYEENYKSIFNSMKLSYVSDKFTDPVKEGVAISRISTGFKNIDEALGGGISEGYITALSGSPSVGKSTFSLQMAENMAANGRKVLYFSYEMGKEQVAAKSVGRSYYICSGQRKGVSALDLLDINKWNEKKGFETKEFKRDYEKAIKNVQRANDNILFFDCTVEHLSINGIEKIVNNFIYLYGEIPVIYIDYLHIIPSPRDENGNEQFTGDKARLDYNLKIMRKISSNLGCTIIFISALKKEDFKSGADMASLIGSSGIPYHCDLMLGLQYGAVNDKDFDLEAEQNLHPRRVELVILKSRYSGVGKRVKLDYYNSFDFFDDKADKWGWKSTSKTENRRSLL